MADKLTVQQQIAERISKEVQQSRMNMQYDYDDFEAAIDLIENVRVEKDYDWMSNVSLPMFASMSLTQAAIDSGTYFKTREFVEVYHEDETDEALAAAESNKVLINKTLNQEHIDHYSKYMRAKIICNNFKNVVVRCWWEQETENRVTGSITRTEKSRFVDINDQPLINEDQIPKTEVYLEDVNEDVPIMDRFNWDVIDPRNVFYDNTYAYSIQDKKWVVIRYERTLAQLEKESDDFNYFNLDELKKIPPPEVTETSRESYNKEDEWAQASRNHAYDIYERHGLEWCVVRSHDEYGNPEDVEFGYDEDGNPREDAEMHELIVTYAQTGTKKVLIRFTVQKYHDYMGKKYRPLIRGINYIHPSKDGGTGDAQYGREIQKFINDTINMSNDRVKLATLPTLKGNKDALADNETVYFAPEHVIELYDTKDLEEMKIESDISGAMQMINLGVTGLQDVMAIFRTTQGNLPEDSSTTATAIAGAEQNTDTRTSYRSTTWEHTFLTKFYRMITLMTWQFAFEDTALKLFGNRERLMAFRPDYEFFYEPITGTIETEYSKNTKIKDNIAIMQIVGQSPNPGAPSVFNMLLVDTLELKGMDKKKYAKALMDASQPMTNQSGPGSTPKPGGGAVSNQNEIPISEAEAQARGI